MRPAVLHTLRHRLAALALSLGVLFTGGAVAWADLPAVFGKQTTSDATVDNLCVYTRGANPQCLLLGQFRNSNGKVGALALGRRPVIAYYNAFTDAGDYTPAFQRSLADQGMVYAPASLGPYPISSVTLADGQYIQGDGQSGKGTTIQASSLTGDVIVANDAAHVRDVYFTTASGGRRTSGAYIDFVSAGGRGRGQAANIRVENGYDGVILNEDSVQIQNLTGGFMAHNFVNVQSGYNLSWNEGYYYGNAANPHDQPQACLAIHRTGDITVRGVRLTYCGEALQAIADIGNIYSIVISDSFLDSSYRALHLLIPAGSPYNIVRTKVSNTWIGNSCDNGALIEALSNSSNVATGQTPGKMEDISFIQPEIVLNNQNGILTTGAVPTLQLTGVTAYGNGGTYASNLGGFTCPAGGTSAGAFNLSSQTSVRATNTMAGSTTEGPANSMGVIAAAGASGSFVGGKITDPLADSTGGTGLRYIGVKGIVTSNRFPITIPSGTTTASGFPFAHGLSFLPYAGDWTFTPDQSLVSTGATNCWLGNPTTSQLTAYCSATTTAAISGTVSIEIFKARSY